MVEVSLLVIIGTVGAFLILIAFILNILGKLTPDNLSYILSNLIGSLLLIYYAILIKAYPFVLINIVWGGFALYKLLKVSKQ